MKIPLILNEIDCIHVNVQISWVWILHDFKMPVKTDFPIFYTVYAAAKSRELVNV